MEHIVLTKNELIVLFNEIKPERMFSNLNLYELSSIDKFSDDYVESFDNLFSKKVIGYDLEGNVVIDETAKSIFDSFFNFSKLVTIEDSKGNNGTFETLIKKENFLLKYCIKNDEYIIHSVCEDNLSLELLEKLKSFVSRNQSVSFISDDDYDKFVDNHSKKSKEELLQKGISRDFLDTIGDYYDENGCQMIISFFSIEDDNPEEIKAICNDSNAIVINEVINDDFEFGKNIRYLDENLYSDIFNKILTFLGE